LRAFNPPSASTHPRQDPRDPAATAPANGRSSAHIHTVEALQRSDGGEPRSGINEDTRTPDHRPPLPSARQRPVFCNPDNQTDDDLRRHPPIDGLPNPLHDCSEHKDRDQGSTPTPTACHYNQTNKPFDACRRSPPSAS
jgi:hypothetical protein